MADPFSTLALATGGAFLGKFVSPAAESLGKLALERAQQLVAKATAYLVAAGREPQPVEPKVLVPLVQAAVLEADPDLTDQWAALLANAADPDWQADFRLSFIEVMKQLSLLDIKLLYAMNDIYTKKIGSDRKLLVLIKMTNIVEAAGLDYEVDLINTSVDNLTRLNLCNDENIRYFVGTLEDIDKEPRHPEHEAGGKHDRIALTYFGFAFLQACIPPVPQLIPPCTIPSLP